MINIVIDISKGKSAICTLKPYGEILCSPYEIHHTETDLSELANSILRFEEETKVVIEATSSYHLPVLSHLKEKGIFVSVINPLIMKNMFLWLLEKAKQIRWTL